MDPIAITFGPIFIYWYGITATIAFLAAFVYLKKIRQKLKIKNNLNNLFFQTVIISLLGARIYHVINELNFYLKHPKLIIQIWKGGLAIHGGVFFGFLFIYYYSKKNKISLLSLLDAFTPTLLLALGIARWGNYFNQELFGRPATLPWSIFIAPANRPAEFTQFAHFHPTFLYQSLWCLIGVLLITLWIIKKPKLKPGLMFTISLIIWSTSRIITELLRIDSVPIIFGLRLPLLISILITVAGIITLYCLINKELLNSSGR